MCGFILQQFSFQYNDLDTLQSLVYINWNVVHVAETDAGHKSYISLCTKIFIWHLCKLQNLHIIRKTFLVHEVFISVLF